VIGVAHPEWQERPLAVVVLNEGKQAQPAELREFLATKFAKWQLPDAFVFASEIPRTSVGKFRKIALREQFADEYAELRDVTAAGHGSLASDLREALDASRSERLGEPGVPGADYRLLPAASGAVALSHARLRAGQGRMPYAPLGRPTAGSWQSRSRNAAGEVPQQWGPG